MLKSLVATTFLAANLAAPAFSQDADQPAYLVATLEVSDLNAYFANYGGLVFPMLAETGAEALVSTPTVKTLEGEYGATWTAIVRFPSMEALDAWYNSAEYQAVAPARNVVGTIRIDDLGDDQSHAAWSAQMELDPASADQVRSMVTGMYEQGLASLENHYLS